MDNQGRQSAINAQACHRGWTPEIDGPIKAKEAQREREKMKSTSLLSVSADSKTVKGEKLGYLTGILYMAPYKLSGVNLCPMAELAQCSAACLFTAGRASFTPSINIARLRKAEEFNTERKAFMALFVKDVQKLIRKAAKLGFTPVVRPNGTTDIRWENEPVQVDGVEYPNIMSAFPMVQFMDYTKIPNRKNIPENYHLTWSYSGANQRYADMMPANVNVSVVFSGKLPASFLGRKVVNGDETDLRFLDPEGVIVGLKAKGSARKDETGFVVWM
jgi:hypothetical protein